MDGVSLTDAETIAVGLFRYNGAMSMRTYGCDSNGSQPSWTLLLVKIAPIPACVHSIAAIAISTATIVAIVYGTLMHIRCGRWNILYGSCLQK